MASTPVVQSTNSSFDTTATSHAVSMPSGITAGDKLLVFFTCDGSRTVNTPAGWTKELDRQEDSGSEFVRLVAYSKTAAGSDTLTVTTSGNTDSGHIAYRIVTNNSYEFLAVDGGASTTPNPPSLTPTGGSQKYLWFAVCAFGATTVSAYPTNYSSNQVSQTSSSFGIAAATYANEATSEDPATYTIGASTLWVAATVAVEEQDAKVGTPPVLGMTGSFPAGTISYGATGTTAVLGMTASLYPTSRTSYERTKWTTTTKS